MIFLSIWTFIVAISISIVAAYYSIVGLTAIFAAAVVPVIIMGTVLEVGKITTAIWLHLNWKRANTLIKSYLVTSTFVLMLITSMGIFGFLSRAHIEQQSATQDQFAKISQIEQQILFNENDIKVKTNEISDLSANKGSLVSELQSQIDIEQERIDRALERIKPEIQEQENIIANETQKTENRIAPIRDTITDFENRIQALQAEKNSLQNNNQDNSTLSQQITQLNESISTIDQEISLLNTLQNGDRSSIRRLQSIIGVNPDGQIGRDTLNALNTYVANATSQRNELASKVSELSAILETNRSEFMTTRNARLSAIDQSILEFQNEIKASRDAINTILSTPSDTIEAARNRIVEIRNSTNEQIDLSNSLIQNLRQELKTLDDTDDRTEIANLEAQIKSARDEISDLTSEKFVIESEIRKLEAEVGPIKYIAELIYEDASDKDTLEKAVRIVILLLVFVFDPLAIVLVIAAISTFEYNRSPKINIKEETQSMEKDIDAIENIENIEAIENIDDINKIDTDIESQIEMNFDDILPTKEVAKKESTKSKKTVPKNTKQNKASMTNIKINGK